MVEKKKTILNADNVYGATQESPVHRSLACTVCLGGIKSILNNKCIIPRYKSACHKYSIINYRKAIRLNKRHSQRVARTLMSCQPACLPGGLCTLCTAHPPPCAWAHNLMAALRLTFFKWGYVAGKQLVATHMERCLCLVLGLGLFIYVNLCKLLWKYLR